MSKPTITPPAEVYPERITENVYEVNGSLDTHSQDQFDVYSVERMHGKDSPQAEHYDPTTGISEKSGFRRDGWLLRPRTALIATVLASIAISVAGKGGMFPKTMDKYVADPIGDLIDSFDREHETIYTETAPKTEAKSLTYNLSQPGREQASGVADKDADTAVKVIKIIGDLNKDPNTKATKIKVISSSSDEWLSKGDTSLGVPDSENRQLSQKRAGAIEGSIKRIADRRNTKLPGIDQVVQESVLKDNELGKLMGAVNRNNYGSAENAIKAYNVGDEMPKSLKQTISQLIGSKRKNQIVVEYQQTTPGTEARVEATKKPIDEDHDFPFGILLIPPIPRFTRKKTNLLLEVPKLPEKVPPKVWVELYPEAKKMQNDELVDESWALTRKYQYLMREQRMQQLATFDFVDEKGKDQTFRVGFVDHKPSAQTLHKMSELLKKIALLKDGKIPEQLNMITVFPDTQTGAQHPKKYGLGIDDQYGKEVLGIAIPALSLVEMQMPVSPTERELNRYMGMLWVMAHEVGGHFSDIKQQPTTIKRTNHPKKPRQYEASNPWLNSATNDYASLDSRSTVLVEQIQFTIPDEREDGNEVMTDEYIVNMTDENFIKASFLRLRGMFPTLYSETNPAELHAESVAQALTAIPIPLRSVGIAPSKDQKTKGYSIDNGLLFNISKRVGSRTNRDGFAWTKQQVERIESSWKVSVSDLNDNSGQNKLSEKAKHTPYVPDEDRLQILAGAKD